MSQLLQYYKSFQFSRAPAVNTTPTFADLSIDDKLSELQRIIKYSKSTIGLQRLVHVKMLADIASTLRVEVIASQLVPLLDIFGSDFEIVIKHHFVEQLAPFARVCVQHGDIGYNIVIERVLPHIASALEEVKIEVRQAAATALVEVAKIIRPDDLGQYVLTIVLRLAHEDDREDMKMTAAELLNLLADCLGYDLCRQFVIPEVVSLAEDPLFRVRKSTALNFHNICKVGGEYELFERLMPAFVRLSKDDVYRVRKACAESLPKISEFVSDDIRVGVLVEIFLRLTQDPSKVVKQVVLQQSGMFISTLPRRIITESILSHYCSMVSDPTGDLTLDNELRYHCAYSFPGVFQSIGGARWREVKDVYMSLIACRAVKIRQTLAASLHEVARILNDEAKAEEELAPIFEEMIQEPEEVQMGIMKNLATFLKYLPMPCRISYLPALHDIVHSSNLFRWRLRQTLAIQLPELVHLPPKTEVFTTLFPLAMTLLQDPVASVRKESYKGVSAMILVLAQQANMCRPELNTGDTSDVEAFNRSVQDFESVVRSVNYLIRGDTFHLRQAWLQLCLQLLRDLPKEIFESYFIKGILTLTSDRVAIVRLGVAELLSGWAPHNLSPWEVTEDNNNNNNNETNNNNNNDSTNSSSSNGEYRSPWTWLLKRADIRECVVRLSKEDSDVYKNMVLLKPYFPDIDFCVMSCRGKKAAPGGSHPVPMSHENDNNNNDNNNNNNDNSNINDSFDNENDSSLSTSFESSPVHDESSEDVVDATTTSITSEVTSTTTSMDIEQVQVSMEMSREQVTIINNHNNTSHDVHDANDMDFTANLRTLAKIERMTHSHLSMDHQHHSHPDDDEEGRQDPSPEEEEIALAEEATEAADLGLVSDGNIPEANIEEIEAMLDTMDMGIRPTSK